MRKAVALLLGTLLPLLGLSGIGQAQSSVQVQGIIQAVDCEAQTVVLDNSGSSNTVAVAPYTAVLVNSTSVQLCDLQQYIGAPATAWLVASGSEFVATRIDVVGDAVAPQPVDASTVVAAAPLPIVGIVLGTIVVAGLVYLLVHGPDGRYYRYPYYGRYYHYYYRPVFRPYLRPYPPFIPVITVPRVIAGVVLGIALVEGLEYLIARDRDGRFYRYPYYGPYRQYYYRPEYRPYRGPYVNAPLRQGDPRWDAPAYRSAPVRQAPASQTLPWRSGPGLQNAPARQAPTLQTPPWRNGSGFQNAPVRQTPAPETPRWRNGPGFRNAPVRQAPEPRNVPAYGRPNWNPPAPRDDPRRGNPARDVRAGSHAWARVPPIIDADLV